jgi:3-hydroxy-9,10-secoandrosta-1,3,5(10)-triene-9,17-dione monooxygenase
VIGDRRKSSRNLARACVRGGVTFTTYARQSDSAVVQHQVAEATLDIDAAYLHLMNAAEQVHSAAAVGQPLDYLSRARMRGVVGYATKLLRQAVNTLASMGGASGFANASPLQRMWRDVNIASVTLCSRRTQDLRSTVAPCSV